MSRSTTSASPVVPASDLPADVGAPLVVTGLVGSPQLVYRGSSGPGDWDLVTIRAGSLDATPRRLYILWGANAAANLLPPVMCTNDAGLVDCLRDGRCRQPLSGTAFEVYVYTDGGSAGLLALLLDVDVLSDRLRA